MSQSVYGDVLKERNYMQYLIAVLISRLGDSIDAIAYSWMMYEVTKNASLIAFIMALNFIPTICFQPFLAVLVERMEKKRVIAITALGRGCIVLCTVFLYLNGSINSVYLMVATLLTSTLEAFSLPAGNAIVPKLIPMEKMAEAKSLSASSSTLVELIGTAVAGSIVALLGTHGALLIDFVTFILSALMIALIPLKEKRVKTALTMTGFTKDFTEGFRYLKSHKILLGIIGIGMSMNMINVPFSSFQSIFVADYLKLDAQALSIFSVSIAVGILLGSAVSPKFVKKTGVRKGIVIAGMLFSPCYVLEGILSMYSLIKIAIYGISIVLFFTLGIGFGLMNVLFSTLFVQNVKQEYMARVSGITNALLSAMMPAMALLCSFVAIFLKVNVIFLIVGILNVVIYLWVAKAKIFSMLNSPGNGDT